MHPYVNSSIIYSSQDMENNLSVQNNLRWMATETVVDTYTHTYTHKPWNDYHSTIKREIPVICDNMDGPWVHILSEMKSDRKRQIPYDLTFMWILKTKINNQRSKQTNETHRKADQTVVTRGRGWRNWIKVVSRDKHAVIKQLRTGDVKFNMMTTVNTAVWYSWRC